MNIKNINLSQISISLVKMSLDVCINKNEIRWTNPSFGDTIRIVTPKNLKPTQLQNNIKLS
jgi:hypothetical protein